MIHPVPNNIDVLPLFSASKKHGVDLSLRGVLNCIEFGLVPFELSSKPEKSDIVHSVWMKIISCHPQTPDLLCHNYFSVLGQHPRFVWNLDFDQTQTFCIFLSTPSSVNLKFQRLLSGK